MAIPRPVIDPVIFRHCKHLLDASQHVRRVHRLLAEGAWWPPETDAHLHDATSLVVCVSGSLRVQHLNGNTDLGEGDAMVIEAGAWHGHIISHDRSIYYEQKTIDRRTIWSLHDENRFGNQFAIPLQPTAGRLDQILKTDDDDERADRLSSLINDVLTEPAELQLWEPALRQMWNAIWRNLGRQVTAAEILASAGLSPRHAHRCFVDHFGESPKQMILRFRLALAKAYLRHGAGVAEAARAAGFGQRDNLSRYWRHKLGTSPRTERNAL